jgi:ribosome maturation factor RimP
VDADSLQLEVDGSEVAIPFGAIERAKLQPAD